ncbi:hypothetical protein F2Q69_00014348 [Brassica cretica]|uniref:Uncharacterized protein n=1 Tax=Brassica cretica TaxID=69181 RepID=A0A8S9QQJ3_BRACR|nr:hypothetical protein F2Q69_00014348 [Brassica cretica]
MKHDGISLTSPVPDAFPGTVWERCGDVSETFQRGDGHFCLKQDDGSIREMTVPVLLRNADMVMESLRVQKRYIAEEL